MTFDKKIAALAIRAFKDKGIPVAKGLSETQLKHIEELLGASIPDDLRFLLAEGVPTDDSYPNWHHNPEQIIAESRASIEGAFAFDIEENEYWHESFGPKPADIEAAKKQALSVIRTWPPLIRVYGHRYMPTMPAGSGNPVLSVMQPTDTIYYGNDLADYLMHEFDIQLPVERTTEPPEVPYWGAAFDLVSVRVESLPFNITFLDREIPKYRLESGEQAAYGQITIGNFRELMFVSTEFWTKADYKKQWTDAVQELLAGPDEGAVALIVDMHDPKTANFITCWPLHRRGDVVYVQENLVFIDDLPGPFSLQAVYKHVEPRETVSDDGHKFSEWETTTHDLQQWLDHQGQK